MIRVLLLFCGLILCNDALAGLVGHWKFDSVSGETVKDLSPRGNGGQIKDLEARDGALQFDGFGGHVLVEEKSPFEFSDSLSASVWVRASERKNHTVIFGVPHTTDSWTTPMFGMYIADNRAVFGMWGDRGSSKVLVQSTEELPLDTWIFLTGSYDGKTARLFVNGSLSGEAPHTGKIVRNGQPLILGKGRGYSKPCFKGAIGELLLYDNALGAAEIRTIFEQTKVGYDLSAPVKRSFGDSTVVVETHRSSPESTAPWQSQQTRILELVKGFPPGQRKVELDRFGGRADLPKEKATGFFFVKEIDGRKWLIDPEGSRYFNVGINAVNEPKSVKKRGGDAADQWASAMTDQLRDAGFNGLGNWSSPRLQRVKQPLVWVRRHNFMFEFAKQQNLTEPAAGTVGFKNRCMPVFHPEFESFCAEYAKELADTAGDPALLGIMTDNELQCPVDLLDRYLSFAEDNPGRRAAKEWLDARKGESEISLRARYEFIAFAFERYYRIVTKAVRAVDANHLYLGSRINYHTGEFDNPWFRTALAPYHDVVSVNYYGIWGPDAKQLGKWAAWSGKPVLFTEWYAKAMDVPGLSNAHGAGWLVHTQEDRARYYQHFTLAALELPNVVGWHWFKFSDDPKESVALDSAGGANKGMFDLEGRPYEPLFAKARAVNREVYPLIDFFDSRGR